MSRWALATLVVLFLLGAGAVALARLFGKSGSRASIGVSIATPPVSIVVSIVLPSCFSRAATTGAKKRR